MTKYKMYNGFFYQGPCQGVMLSCIMLKISVMLSKAFFSSVKKKAFKFPNCTFVKDYNLVSFFRQNKQTIKSQKY